MSEDLLSLVDTLYEGTLESPPWLRFLERFESYVGCGNACIVLRKPRDEDIGFVASPHGLTEGLLAFQQRHFRESLFIDLPENQVCTLRTLATAETLESHDYYRNYLLPYGIGDLIGVNLCDAASGITLRLRGSRQQNEPWFSGEDRQRVEQLLPRLRTALAWYARQQLQQYRISALSDTADELAIGSFVLNEAGGVMLQNAIAERITTRADGLTVKGGRLHCTHPASDRRLQEAVASMATASQQAGEPFPGQPLRVARTAAGTDWSLLLKPIATELAHDPQATPTVMVLVRDPAVQPRISAALLSEVFSLTRAEAGLVAKLAEGDSINEIAETLGISIHTARAQLASVFSKTHVNRQPQLIRLVLNTIYNVWQ